MNTRSSRPAFRDWKRALPLVERLVELPAEERAAWLAHQCDDAELAADLLAVVEEEMRDEGFLEPAVLSLETAPPARRVGPYELVRELGRGGMGSVWLAHRGGDYEQDVAIKFVRPGGESEDVLARFHRERQLLADLAHPGIARLLDGGSLDDGRPYLVLEYVEGVPVDRYCSERRSPLARRVELLLEVLEAVDHAHRRLVVHRDLKPSNILVDREGRARLLDFGIAKLLEEGSSGDAHTATGAHPMTVRYASPEQIEGKPISTRSDVYSLGVLAYELLTGRSPYGEAKTTLALMRAVCESDPTPPGAVRSALDAGELSVLGEVGTAKRLPQELDWIVLKALRKDPERRYGTVERMADDLRRFLDGRAVQAGPDSIAYRTRKLVARHRWSVMASVAGVAALVVATVVSFLSARRAQEAARVEAEALRASQGALDFLSGVLASANPQEGGARSVSMLDALVQAEERSQQLEDPVVRLAVLTALGNVRNGLSDLDGAERLARDALALESVAELPPVDFANACNVLGMALREQGRHEEAVKWFESALERLDHPRKGFFERGDQRVAHRHTALMNLAGAIEGREPARALVLYRRIVDEVSGLYGDEHRETLVASFNLATLLLVRGHVEEAERVIAKAHTSSIAQLGEEAFETIAIAHGLARAYLAGGRPAEALVLAQHDVPIAERVLGSDHLWTNLVRYGAAWACVELERLEEAEVFLGPLVGSAELDASTEAAGLRLRADSLARTGRAAEGVELLRAAVERFWSDEDLNAMDRALLVHSLADCEARVGELESAEEHATLAVGAWNELDRQDFELARRSSELLARLRER